MRKTPNQEILHFLTTSARSSLQNVLMRSSDRELALGMMYMEDGDRKKIFSLLPEKKQQRIREELILLKRVRITYKQYLMAVNKLLAAFKSAKGGESFKSYFRPFRRR